MVKSSTRFISILCLLIFSVLAFSNASIAQSKRAKQKSASKSGPQVQSAPVAPASAPVQVMKAEFAPLYVFLQPEKFKELEDNYAQEKSAFKWEQVYEVQDCFRILFENEADLKAFRMLYPQYMMLTPDEIQRYCEYLKCGLDLGFLKSQ